MTVGARLRSKAASSLPRRGPLGRARAAGDEDADAILEHLECEDEAAACGARGARGRRAGARRVHLAALPERYEPLEEPAPEPAPGDKPKKRYRRKLKKYGKVRGSRGRWVVGEEPRRAPTRPRWLLSDYVGRTEISVPVCSREH
jgi:hypothetical protein